MHHLDHCHTHTCSLSLCQLCQDLLSFFSDIHFSFGFFVFTLECSSGIEQSEIERRSDVMREREKSQFFLFSLPLSHSTFQFVVNLSRIITSSFEKDWTWKVQRKSLTQQLVHDTTLSAHTHMSLCNFPWPRSTKVSRKFVDMYQSTSVNINFPAVEIQTGFQKKKVSLRLNSTSTLPA